MIDKMVRCKDFILNDHIGSLNEWFIKCPPMGKEKHWVDGRSAKETAKHWLHTIPQPFKDLLKPFQLNYKICSPEYVSKFDKYRGNARNHDLLLIAENNKNETVVIAIESKVDEEFGEIITKKIAAASKKLQENKNSKALIRIEELRKSLFGSLKDEQLKLRYQLLTAIAGTIAEAKEQNAKTAIFVVQTFDSEEINPTKHSKNQDDLDAFISLFTKGEYVFLKDDKIIGPIRLSENSTYYSSDIDLWIGKYKIEI